MKRLGRGPIFVFSILAACAAVCVCLAAVVMILVGRSLREPSGITRTQLYTPIPTYTVFRSETETSAAVASADPEGEISGIGDPYFPMLGNGGYDVQHYDLDLTVDMAAEEIDAVATIEARSLRILERFNLDLKEIRIGSIKVNGEDASYSFAAGELMIAPAAVIPADSEFTVVVAYSGRPAEGTAFGGIDFLEGWNFYPQGVIVAGEPTGAETWFPSNNHPSDKATYAFRITVAKPYVAAANGILKEETDNGDDTRTYVFVMDDPMASYLATLAVGNFDLVEGTSASGLPFRNYLDADIRGKVEGYIDVLPEAMDYFASLFGPYPFDTCGVVVHQLDIPFSLENQTLIVMGHTFAYEIVVVHELAHQWFGDSVSVASWKDIWLNEGFASYAETLWWEHTEGPEALKEDLSRRYRYNANLPASERILIGDPGPDRLFDSAVYTRGALTLHALRLEVGDEVFFRILREYFETYRDGNAAIQDFIALAEEISQLDLEPLFQAWLYESDLPDIPELGLYAD
jgi:aminopeptidase N